MVNLTILMSPLLRKRMKMSGKKVYTVLHSKKYATRYNLLRMKSLCASFNRSGSGKLFSIEKKKHLIQIVKF
jgi:hypothetical protein